MARSVASGRLPVGGRARAAVAVWLVVCWLAFAPAAGAAVQSFDAGPYLPLAGPRLAGDELVYTQHEPGRGQAVVARPLAGGAARTLHRVNPYVAFQLAASPTQVLVQQTVLPGPNANSQTPAGPTSALRFPRGGAPERLEFRCGVCRLRELDVNGDVIIYQPTSDAFTVRDLGVPGSPPVVVRPAFGSAPRVAGRYAARRLDGEIIVYDWQSRSEVYRVRLTPAGSGLIEFTHFDLQADGKVAFSYIDGTGRGGFRVGWASPQAPQPHPLPVVAPSSVEVRLERDVVAYLRRPGRGDTARGELGVVSLSGEARTLVRPVEAMSGDELFDFDGERVAWVERSCDGPRVAFAPLDELTASPRMGALPRCELALRTRPRLTDRGRALALGFDCTGLDNPCFHKQRVVRTARRYHLAGRPLARGTRITLPSRDPSQSAVARLRLTKTGKRLLKSRRTISLEVVARIDDGDYTPRRQTRTTSRR